MPYIDVIQHEDATGDLKSIYDHLVATRGKLAEVHKIQSLHPKSITAHMDLYMEIMFTKSPLRRYQREMIAVIVSVTNDCLYCQTHHGEALNHFWKDQTKIDQLVADFEQSQLSATDLELCRLAQRITASPNQGTAGAHFTELRKLEVSDRLLLDAMLVIAYFNFVNRLVLGLGVQLEENPGGYEYE